VVRTALAVAAVTLSGCAIQQSYGSVDATLLSIEDVRYCDMQAQMAAIAADTCLRMRAAAHPVSLADMSILQRVIVPDEEPEPEPDLAKPEPNRPR
jgi:hypothetical protein